MSTIKPYGYQKLGIDKLTADRATGNRRQSLIMATGLGKTYTVVLGLKKWLPIQPGRVAIFCHQTNILDQWEDAFRAIFGNDLSYGRYQGNAPKAPNADVMFGSFQSMANGRDEFDPAHFGHVFVDESHHGPARTYRPTIEHFAPHAHLLGLTATPNRADAQSIADIFGKPTFELPLELALASGYLTKVRYLLLSDGIQNLDRLPTNLGSLNVKALNKLFFAPERDERIVELIAEHTAHLGEALRMMVFCRSIAHAERYGQLLPNAWAVHSKLRPHWQDKRIQDYLDGDKKAIVTVNKFNEGVDYPATNVGVMLREHGTETGFLQQFGRLLRLHEGKEEVLVLDFAGNCERLEQVNELHRRVRSIYDNLQHSVSGAHLPKPFEATVGEFEFDVTTKKVIDVLATVRGGYTKEVLKEQLLNKSVDGVMPTKENVSQDPDMADPTTFERAFGKKWSKIAEELELAPSQASCTKPQLAQQLLAKSVDGVMPSRNEVDEDPNMANSNTFTKWFNKSWEEIAKELGLTPSRDRLLKERLAQQILTKSKDGIMPKTREVLDDPNMASPTTFLQVFGKKWSGIAEELGLRLAGRSASCAKRQATRKP